MIPSVQAVQFIKVMASGRTRPCLLLCEDEDGAEVEAVVKLRGHPQITPGVFASESTASLFAADLGFSVPQPFAVSISKEFAATVPDSMLRPVFEASVGPNFGCAKWGPGQTIWPKDNPLNQARKPAAMEIFAFDGLIQNVDRKEPNPNCVFLGDNFLIYDHEAAFSHFLMLFFKNPWEQGGVDFLRQHIFYNVLRGTPLELNRLQGALEAVEAARYEEYVQAVPSSWDGETVTRGKIAAHLLNCASQFDRIKQQLQSIL